MKKTTIAGIGIVAMILTSLGTIYVKDIGEKTSCRRGWEYADGYYSCTTNSGIRYETCFEVYDSANTENYWCKKGVRVEPIIVSNQPMKGDWKCPKRPNDCIEQ